MVFIALIDDEVDAEVVFINTIHRIADDTGITVAFGIVLLDDVFLILLVVLFQIFRAFEDARAIIVVEILFHTIDGSQRMQGKHIC